MEFYRPLLLLHAVLFAGFTGWEKISFFFFSMHGWSLHYVKAKVRVQGQIQGSVTQYNTACEATAEWGALPGSARVSPGLNTRLVHTIYRKCCVCVASTKKFYILNKKSSSSDEFIRQIILLKSCHPLWENYNHQVRAVLHLW